MTEFPLFNPFAELYERTTFTGTITMFSTSIIITHDTCPAPGYCSLLPILPILTIISSCFPFSFSSRLVSNGCV